MPCHRRTAGGERPHRHRGAVPHHPAVPRQPAAGRKLAGGGGGERQRDGPAAMLPRGALAGGGRRHGGPGARRRVRHCAQRGRRRGGAGRLGSPGIGAGEWPDPARHRAGPGHAAGGQGFGRMASPCIGARSTPPSPSGRFPPAGERAIRDGLDAALFFSAETARAFARLLPPACQTSSAAPARWRSPPPPRTNCATCRGAHSVSHCTQPRTRFWPSYD